MTNITDTNIILQIFSDDKVLNKTINENDIYDPEMNTRCYR